MNVIGNPPTGQANSQLPMLETRAHSGARWFYWIAALSLVNSITALLHIDGSFVMGLFTTQILDAISRTAKSPSLTTVLFVFGLVIIGVYALFGFFACKLQKWAFITGLVCYSLDTAILLIGAASGEGGVILSLVFHAWAILGIVGGLKAANQLKKLNAQLAQDAYMTGQQPQQPYYQPPVDPTNPGGAV